MADKPWIERLRGCPVDQESLDGANLLVAIGSTSLTGHAFQGEEITSDVAEARREFYGTFLRWDEPSHYMHSAYLYRIREKRFIGRISTFVAGQRVFEANGIDGAKVVKGKTSVISRHGEAIQDHIDNIVKNGFDAKIVESVPQLIGYSVGKVDRSLGLISNYAERFGWSGDKSKLLSGASSIVSISDRNLKLRLRLLYDKLAEYIEGEPTSNLLARYFRIPVESHIIALALGKEYTAATLEEVNELFTDPQQRSDLLNGLMQKPKDLENKIGRKAMIALENYLAEEDG